MASNNIVQILAIIFTILYGLAAGSFVNAWVYRLAHGKSIAAGRSFCPHCQHTLAPWDLVPLVSFLFLRGRCRYCKKTISWQYPGVEAITALLFLYAYTRFGFQMESVVVMVYIMMLEIVFLYDLKKHLISDLVLIPTAIVALLALPIRDLTFINALIGSAIAAGFFGLQYLLSRGKWIGAGDIRLGVVMGLMLGWRGVIVALLLAYTLGAIVGVVLMLSKKATGKTEVPFGTFLSLATVVTLLYGTVIIEWYFDLIGL